MEVVYMKIRFWLAGYAIDPSVYESGSGSIISRLPTDNLGNPELNFDTDKNATVNFDGNNEIKTVFEKITKRQGDKRKKAKNNDPADIEGFVGPWAAFVDEKRNVTPNEVRFL